MVAHCINLVTEFFERKGSKVSPNCKFINAAHIQSSNFVLAEIADSIGQKSTDTKKIEQSLKFRSEKSKRLPLVLVLDEIDLLLSGKIKDKKGEESFLKTLFRWAAEPQNGLILIGISNSVGSKDAKRLHQIGKVRCFCSFSFHAPSVKLRIWYGLLLFEILFVFLTV